MPTIAIYQHAEEHVLDLARLETLAQAALPLVLPHPGKLEPLLENLEEVEISLISDDAIAEVHGQFLEDPTPTDVITFHHGEILISLDTAARVCGEHGHEFFTETLLYLIHGLLHLNGHDDHEPDEASAMAALQERILHDVLAV